MDLFIPLSDSVLLSDTPLNKADLDLIQRSIEQSEYITNSLCTHLDDDVIQYHYNYLSKCIARLEKSLKNIRKERYEKLNTNGRDSGIIYFRRR